MNISHNIELSLPDLLSIAGMDEMNDTAESILRNRGVIREDQVLEDVSFTPSTISHGDNIIIRVDAAVVDMGGDDSEDDDDM